MESLALCGRGLLWLMVSMRCSRGRKVSGCNPLDRFNACLISLSTGLLQQKRLGTVTVLLIKARSTRATRARPQTPDLPAAAGTKRGQLCDWKRLAES